jgi:hypothetical protein
MNTSFKVSRGDDISALCEGVVKLCQKFWDEANILEISVEPVFGNATTKQNNQQFEWYKEAEKQGDMTAKEYRADCKAYCGVPILVRDSEEFREQYNRIVKPLPYEHKLELMVEPFDFPVTSLMNKKQKSEFLDAVFLRLTTEHGIHLEGKNQ